MFYSKRGLLFTSYDNRVLVNVENVYNMQEWGKKSYSGFTEQVSRNSTKETQPERPSGAHFLRTHVVKVHAYLPQETK